MQEQPQEPTTPKPSRHKLYVILGIIGIVLILAAIILALVANKKPSSPQATSESGAETMLYNALENAAQQQKLRVGMYRETFANKSDADARQNIGTYNSSVSEIDTGAGKYRNVYATSTLMPDGSFTVGRCLDKDSYNDFYQNPPATKTERAKTLEDASTRLKLIPEGNLYKVTIDATFVPCPHVGLMPADPPIPVAYLSDGLMPVTLSDSQAENWREQLVAAGLFTIKDEGIVERDGKKLHKISFQPKSDPNGVNQRLYDIFYDAAEIAKVKSSQPQFELDYQFLSINPLNSGGIGGYYLIDSGKNLPVYSELKGINPDKKDATPAAKRNIARTKQTYTYPQQLTMDINTPLEFLE